MLEIKAIEKATKLLLEAGIESTNYTKDLKNHYYESLQLEYAPPKEQDATKKFLDGTDIFCARVEKAIHEIRKFVSTLKNWNEKKDKRLKNLVGTLKLILQITYVHAFILRYITPVDKREPLERVLHLADEIDDTIENLELIIKFYNKEKGNELQTALTRLKDKDDPIISSDELRKLLGL